MSMSYNPDATPPARPATLHLTAALVASTLAIFVATQIGNSLQGKKQLNWQIATSAKQITTAKENKKQFDELIKQQDTLVKQSGEVQSQLNSLLEDLLKLSSEDDDAKAIVDKWKIQRPATPAAATDSKPADK